MDGPDGDGYPEAVSRRGCLWLAGAVAMVLAALLALLLLNGLRPQHSLSEPSQDARPARL